MLTRSTKCKLTIFSVSFILLSLLFSGCKLPTSRITVTRFSPEGEVPRKSNFTIVFSKPMVVPESVDVWQEPTFLKIEPDIEGKCKWISEQELRFYPEELLRPSTKYRFEILPQIVQMEGPRLSGKKVFEFYTARINIDNLAYDYRIDEKEPGVVRIHATFEFNYEIAPSDLQEKLRIRFENGENITYEIEQESPSLILTAVSEPLSLKDMNMKIHLHVDKNLKPVDGTLGLLQDYDETFRMPAPKKLVVETAFPECSEEANWITVRFSIPVNLEALKDFIQIEPHIDFHLQSQQRYVYIHGDFAASAEYTLTLKKGLPALNGSQLENEFSTHVVMKELEPYFDFITEGIFLPSKGNLNVGIQTVNIDKLELSIEKVFINNLVYFLNTNQMYSSYFDRDYLGKHVTREEIEIEGNRNAKVMTTVNMADYLTEERQGIFVLILRRPEYRWDSKIKWVRMTDLGIIAKKAANELTVFVNSLETMAPQKGVQVKLFSRTNQVLLEGVTNSDGVVSFQDYHEAVKGFYPFVITAEKGNDLSFLKFSDSRLSLADFDVGGAPILKEGYEAFVYTDRGVYRPGDTVHIAAVIRDVQGDIPPDFPIKNRVVAPDGSIFNEYRGWVGDMGADEFNIAIPIYAMTGVYTSRILIADSIEIGRVRFNVEEFMPQRIKVELSLDKERYRSGEEVQFDVNGTMLFGPPAAGRKVKAKYTISSYIFAPVGFHSFHFADEEKQFDKIDTELGEATLDDGGKKTYKFNIPENLKPPSALTGLLEVSVFELGGRAVTEHRSFMIHPYPMYIGLRRQEEGYANKGEEVHIDYVVVTPDGEKVQPRNLEFSYYMVKWHSILERDASGYYRYISEKTLDLVDRKEITYNGDISSVSFIPHHYGQYKVMIEDPKTGVSASIDFYVSGWGYAPWAMSQPEKLMIDFDKDIYKIGDEAEVQIRSPFPGKLILTVEREGILERRVMQMEQNTATITIPVKEAYKPNVYVVGHLIRSNKSLEIHAPLRAYGAYPLMVDCEDKKLTVNVKAPDQIKPRSTLEISVDVDGGTGITYLTVAAVDEGICQITDFITPDPFAFFDRKKRLSVEAYDIYSFILPELEQVEEKSSTGGGLAEGMARHLMPVAIRRVKPVALWSGILRTDRDGKTTVQFKVPQFQGNLRVMAVAYDKDTYGSAFKNVTVSDPIVLTPTFPRFIAGTDSFNIPVNVYNGTAKKGEVTVALTVEGPVSVLPPLVHMVNVESKREQLVTFTCEARNEVEALHFTLDASGLGSSTTHDVDIALRPASPLITEVGAGRIEDNGEASIKIDQNWIEGTTRFHLSLSSFPSINFGHSLRFLLQYPHGCIEQTTSKVFPLLYFSDIAKIVEPSLFKDRSADYYIQEGISKLRSMQMTNGAFSYWPGGDRESEWGSIYATHFLVSARKAGYEIPDQLMNRAVKHLKDLLRKRLEREYRRSQLERQAYVAYVLALFSKPDKSTMNYLKQVELKNMSTWAQVLLAGAFGLSGDINTAKTMIPFEIAPSESPRETGGNFNSGVRENAIILEVLSEIDPENASIPVLVEALSKKLREQSYYTTQESAYGFMALGKILSKQKTADYTGEVRWNGDLLGSFDTENTIIDTAGGEGKQVKIKIDGKGPCYYYWHFSGIRKDADIEEYNRGLMVTRSYFDKFGKSVNYEKIYQGDIVVAKIKMKALTDNLENVIITDMLPAGLEIENPRLQSSSTLSWIGDKSIVPEYMDIRDDRLNIYLNLRKGKEIDFYYMLRAVTVGKFVLPPVKGEAMYDPFKSSVANSGMIKVLPAE